MKLMRRFIPGCLCLAVALVVTSCAAPPEPGAPGSDTTATGERLNTKPWNLHQSWEGQGPLGSALPQRE